MKQADSIVMDAWKDKYKYIFCVPAALLAIMSISTMPDTITREKDIGVQEQISETAPHFIMSNITEEGQPDLSNLFLLRNLGLRPIL